MSGETIGHIIGVTTIVILFATGLWVTCSAPCSWYRNAAQKDIPARCVAEFYPKGTP